MHALTLFIAFRFHDYDSFEAYHQALAIMAHKDPAALKTALIAADSTGKGDVYLQQLVVIAGQTLCKAIMVRPHSSLDDGLIRAQVFLYTALTSI